MRWYLNIVSNGINKELDYQPIYHKKNVKNQDNDFMFPSDDSDESDQE